MKSLKFFKDKEKARQYRNNQKRKNYNKGNIIKVKGRKYTKEEDYELLHSTLNDRTLAQELNRSVLSIQTRRSKIKNKIYPSGAIKF